MRQSSLRTPLESFDLSLIVLDLGVHHETAEPGRCRPTGGHTLVPLGGAIDTGPRSARK